MMIKIVESPAREDVLNAVKDMLLGTSVKRKIHWNNIVAGVGADPEFIGPIRCAPCSMDTLIQLVNSLLMPHGQVSGANHYFWIGPPSAD